MNKCRRCHFVPLGKYSHTYYLKTRAEQIKQSMDWQVKHPQRTKEINKLAKKNQRVRLLVSYSRGVMECSCCREPHLEFLKIDKLGNRLLCYNCYANRKSCPHVTDRKKYLDSLIKTL